MKDKYFIEKWHDENLKITRHGFNMMRLYISIGFILGFILGFLYEKI